MEYSSFVGMIQFCDVVRKWCVGCRSARWLLVEWRLLRMPMSSQVRIVTVTENEDGQRLDNFLVSRLKGLPRSALYKLIRRGEVRINKGRAKPDTRLMVGDAVRIPPVRLAERGEPPTPSKQLSERLRAGVLWDQDGLLIVNKPSGIAVHGGSGVNLGLIEALRQLPENRGFLELVHRLDKETSGCVMLARKRSVLKLLQEALRQRTGIQKTYLALVQGEWPKSVREVDVALKRFVTASGERIVRTHTEGRPSVTLFRVLQRYSKASLVEARPVTGRTHQIRVHAAHVGCPLVGDAKYGDTPINQQLTNGRLGRLFLHASALELSLPEPFRLRVEAPMPTELTNFLPNL